MRILQVSASYKPAYCYGGPIMSVAKLAEQLQAGGHQVEVFCTTANGTSELSVTPGKRQLVDGVPVRYFRRLSKDHSHFSPALLRTLWKEARTFDVVHIHAWWNLVSVCSCLLAILRGVPVIFSPRGTLSSYSFSNRHINMKALFQKILGRWLLNNCYIHVTAENEAQALWKLCRPRALYMISNFVRLPALPPCVVQQPTHQEPFLRIIFLSRLEKKKGLDLLLDALAFQQTAFRLSIAGDGEPDYVEQLKKIAEERNIAEYISWRGFRYDDKFSMLAEHDLLVLPSHDENFGNVVIESLSMGTPVLVSRGVGLASYVASSGLGWVCNNTPQELRETIYDISQQHEQRQMIRHTAAARINIDFGDLTLLHQYQNMYQSVYLQNR